jgi:hypothetical protein
MREGQAERPPEDVSKNQKVKVDEAGPLGSQGIAAAAHPRLPHEEAF